VTVSSSMKEKIQEARETFGEEILSEVLAVVQMSDADGAYSMFEDMGMFEHSECVEFIYFE
jgi:hypothetical protein